MTTLLAFAAKTASLGPEMRAAETAGVRAGALQATETIRRSIKAAAPSGTLRMNGKPKRIGASFKMTGATSARLSAEGPLHLIERDTQPHYEPRAAGKSLLTYRTNKKTGATTVRERKRRGRAGQGRVLNIPGIGFRRMVLHPGTKGKHPFERGADLARAEVGRTILTEVTKGLSAALR